MVFGNMGDTSATGVAFTRNPSTGERALYGEFLINAQGEDVVAGIRTPQDITEKARIEAKSDRPSMEKAMPDSYAELVRIYGLLENHYRDMQDMEFTIESGKLWMLQTRNGKRTAKAALRIAVDLAAEGLITEEEAIGRVEPAASTSSCTRPSTPRPSARSSPPACPPRRAPPPARSCSTPRMPRPPARPSANVSSCAWRPRRRTFTACTPPRAS